MKTCDKHGWMDSSPDAKDCPLCKFESASSTGSEPQYYGQGQTPHRCPVCVGKGIVSNGFYIRTAEVVEYTTSDVTPEKCRACNGTGILWR